MPKEEAETPNEIVEEDSEDEWTAPFGGDGEDSRSLAPFATTPDARIKEMIALAKVKETDTVVDLGAGDGRVLCHIWHHAKAKEAIGFEINKDLVSSAKTRLREEKCPENYRIINQDVTEVDLSPFSVIFAWLQPWAMDLLASKLEECIHSRGTRVISYQWPINALERTCKTTIGVTKNMFLYEKI